MNFLASFKFGLHFLDAGSCLVPMLQRENQGWRWSMGTRSAILH